MENSQVGNRPLDAALSRRRALLFGGALTMAATPLVSPITSNVARAAESISRLSERSLTFRNLHTGETLNTVYWANGEYLDEARSELNRVFRDRRTDEVGEIDIRLLDYLHVFKKTIECEKPLEIICGYRSPTTNTRLAEVNGGVARRSYHMRGMAIDVCAPDVDLLKQALAANELDVGGVGFYPASNFVHMDVGPPRTWGRLRKIVKDRQTAGKKAVTPKAG